MRCWFARAEPGAVAAGLWQSNQAGTEFHGVGTELHGTEISQRQAFLPDASQPLRPRCSCSAKLRANFVETVLCSNDHQAGMIRGLWITA
jgi:hypothetical protein